MWKPEREGGRSRWGGEEGKKRALGKDGGGGRKGERNGREEEERVGRPLFVVLWIGHSGVIKKQERKEMCPGWAAGVRAQSTPHPAGCDTSHSPWPQAAPLQVEALTLLFPAVWTSRPSSQCLPTPAHALTLLQFVYLYQLCLPSELQAVSGSSPHPTAGQGHVRASVRMRKSVPPSGQTQLCARPPKTREEVLGLAVRPLLSPRGPSAPPFPQGPNIWGPWDPLPKSSYLLWLCHLVCEQHTHPTPILHHSLWASAPN